MVSIPLPGSGGFPGLPGDALGVTGVDVSGRLPRDLDLDLAVLKRAERILPEDDPSLEDPSSLLGLLRLTFFFCVCVWKSFHFPRGHPAERSSSHHNQLLLGFNLDTLEIN